MAAISSVVPEATGWLRGSDRGRRPLTARPFDVSRRSGPGAEGGAARAARLHHGVAVDEFMTRTAHGLTTPDLVRLGERALGALCACAHRALGEATLATIFDCVLYHGARRFPRLAGLTLEGAHVRVARPELVTGSANGLRVELRAVLVELLTALGSLTAEILTPLLHAELARVPRLEPASEASQL